MLLGSGELGKEVAIEASRLGLEVIAVDKYKNAPDASSSSFTRNRYVENQKLAELIRIENPAFILPEIEAIATDVLVDLEAEGFKVCPSARAVF